MPIEYTGGPSQEYLNNNAAWASDMALRGLADALTNHYKATAQLILDKNPNIGIRTNSGRSLYGNDAANYLNSLQGEYFRGDTLMVDEASPAAAQNPGQPQERRPGPIPKPGPDPTKPRFDPCRGHSWDWRLLNIRIGLSDAGLDFTRDNKLSNPENRSLTAIANDLQKAGWEQFSTNINPQHWGGIHFEGQIVSGSWWHMIFYPAQKEVIGPRQVPKEVNDWAKPPIGFEMHCERGMLRPSSIWHGLDYLREVFLEGAIRTP